MKFYDFSDTLPEIPALFTTAKTADGSSIPVLNPVLTQGAQDAFDSWSRDLKWYFRFHHDGRSSWAKYHNAVSFLVHYKLADVETANLVVRPIFANATSLPFSVDRVYSGALFTGENDEEVSDRNRADRNLTEGRLFHPNLMAWENEHRNPKCPDLYWSNPNENLDEPATFIKTRCNIAYRLIAEYRAAFNSVDFDAVQAELQYAIRHEEIAKNA